MSVLKFGSADAALQRLADMLGKRVVIAAAPTLQQRVPELLKILNVDETEFEKDPRKKRDADELILNIGRADPKNGGDLKKEAPFVKLIAKWVKDGTVIIPEDVERTNKAIARWQHFIYNTKGLSGKLKDEQVKNWKELKFSAPGEMSAFVDENKVETRGFEIEEKKEVGSDPFSPINKKVIAEANGIKVYKIDSWPEAEVAFQRGLPGESENMPDWCVAPIQGTGAEPSFFKQYGTPFYMFARGSKRIALLNGRHGQFKDINDVDLKEKSWKEIADVIRSSSDLKRDLLRSENLSDSMFKHGVLDKEKLTDEEKTMLMLRYVDRGKLGEIKNMLKNDEGLTAKFERTLLDEHKIENMIKYAVEVRNERWPELERLISERKKKGESGGDSRKISHLIMMYHAHFKDTAKSEDDFSKAKTEEENTVSLEEQDDHYLFTNYMVISFEKLVGNTWKNAFDMGVTNEVDVDKKTGKITKKVLHKLVTYPTEKPVLKFNEKEESVSKNWNDIDNLDTFLKEQARLVKQNAEKFYHDEVRDVLLKNDVYISQFSISDKFVVSPDSRESYNKIRKEAEQHRG